MEQENWKLWLLLTYNLLMLEKSMFEEVYSELLVEYILYLRDRNPEKDWGHIWGWTTVFSYCRWNQKTYFLPVPSYRVVSFSFGSVSIETELTSFSEKEIYFIEKYSLLNKETLFSVSLEEKDREIYPLVYNILEWQKAGFIKKTLHTHVFKNSFLFPFLLALSNFEKREFNYYFKFSEMFSSEDILLLHLSIRKKGDYLFSFIALASASFHAGKKDFAYKLYKKALSLDPDNPWVLGKLAILYVSFGDQKSLIDSLETIDKVQNLLPDTPWVYAWMGEIANAHKKYALCLQSIEKYDVLTLGKHRTFEPYLRKAEALYFLGNFPASREELKKRDLYYFGEGYHFQYDILDKNLSLLGY